MCLDTWEADTYQQVQTHELTGEVLVISHFLKYI
jgi:hypothetical protein